MPHSQLNNILILQIHNSDAQPTKKVGDVDIITHSGFHEMHDRKPIKKATVLSVHDDCDEDIKVGDTALIAFIVDTQDTYTIDRAPNGDKIVAVRCKNTYALNEELQGYAYTNTENGDRFYCGMPDFILQFRSTFDTLTPKMQEKWKEADDRYDPKKMKEQKQTIYTKGQPIYRSMVYGVVRGGEIIPTSDFVFTEDFVESNERVLDSGIVLMQSIDTTIKKDALYRGTIIKSKVPSMPIGTKIIADQFSNITIDIDSKNYTLLDKEDIICVTE
jgi:co-chaperonin GroES (HSP10)